MASVGEHWHIAGLVESAGLHGFEAVARLAGQKMASLTLPEVLTSFDDDLDRWVWALRHRGSAFTFGTVAELVDNENILSGIIYAGTVNCPAEESANLCLRLEGDWLPNDALPLSALLLERGLVGPNTLWRKAVTFFFSRRSSRSSQCRKGSSKRP